MTRPDDESDRIFASAAELFGAEMARALERVDNGCNLYDALYPDGDPEWDAFEAECAARAAHAAVSL